MLNGENLPRILIELPNWIVWKHEIRNKKPTKVPYDAKGHGAYAKSNDSSTWATFDVAFSAANDILNDWDGVGFMLQGTDLVGIDFDGVLHDGIAEPFVLEILEKLGSPYCEVTPSGNGLRAFVQCAALPPGQRKFSGNHYGAEIYSGAEGGRYLTCTSNQFSGSGVPKIENIDLAYFLVSQIRNDKFKKLWMGDLSEYGDDQSRADLALLDILALLLNKDPQKVESIFGASKLGQRDKWTARKDYRDRTIAKALGSGPAPVPPQREPQYQRTDEPSAPAEAIFILGTDIKPKKIDWFWQDRIPFGKITLFTGNPDNGKSLAANSIAAICTTGRAFADCPNPTPAAEVLMMLGEDDLDDTAVPRLIAAGADMSKIHFFDSMKRATDAESAIRLDWDLKPLETKIEQHPNIRLIIIDPISNYLGDVSMVAEQEVRSILIPLKKIAAERGIAIVIVMHLNKKNELDAINRVGGAMAFVGVSRASWMFIRDASTEEGKLKDSFVMARIKNNLVSAAAGGLAYHIIAKPVPVSETDAVMAPFVVWGDRVEKTADEAIESNRSAKRDGPGRPAGVAPKLQEAIDWLERALQAGALTAKDIIKRAKQEQNIKEDTLRSAAKQLGIHPRQLATGWVWDLPAVMATRETVSDDSSVEEEGYDHIDREMDIR